MKLIDEVEETVRVFIGHAIPKGSWCIRNGTNMLRVNGKTSWLNKGAAKNALWAQLKLNIMSAMAKAAKENKYFYLYKTEAKEYFDGLLERKIFEIVPMAT